MSDNKAIPITISLYQDQINEVKNYSRYKQYKYDAEAYQHIINNFFEKDEKQVKNDFVLFFIVPLIFCVLTTIVNISTGKVFELLLEQGYYFNELFWLSSIFRILSFGSIGIFIACIYWLRKVKLSRYIQEVDYGNSD